MNLKKTKKLIVTLEKSIGYSFKNKKLLILALTHSSFKNEIKLHPGSKSMLEDNERLEFLGDTILSFIISRTMYSTFRDFREGHLSKYRSILVSKDLLVVVAKKIKIVRFLRLGKSERDGSMYNKTNILADAIEALIAAIYLDGGMKHAEQFVLRFFGQYIDKKRLSRLDKNYKSMLQEYAQKKFKRLPHYTTVEKKGKFHATVCITKYKKGTGWGTSKQDAEKKAARDVLKKLK